MLHRDQCITPTIDMPHIDAPLYKKYDVGLAVLYPLPYKVT